MDCHEIEELSGAYALDALSPEERKAVDDHLAECPKCAQEIRQLKAVVDLFPLSVPAMDPPPHMKQRIFDKIRANTPITTPRPVTQLPARRNTPTPHWTPVLATIAAVLLISFGVMLGWNISLQQQLQHASIAQTVPTTTPASTPTPNSAITYTIKGTAASSNITGQTIYLPQQNMTLLVLHNLPKLSGNHIYQGWLIDGKQVQSVGILNVHNDTATLDFPGDVHNFDTAAISLEPGPKASPSSPLGPVLATGPLK